MMANHGVRPYLPPDTVPAGYRLSLKGSPFVSQAPVSHLHMLISTLSPRFYGICPFSLVSATLCTVPSCRLLQLCDDYNDAEYEEETGRCERGQNCPKAHELRTCPEEADGASCSWIDTAAGSKSKKKMAHMRMTVHRSRCDKEEWLNRETVARLRDAHVDGWY